MTTPCSSIKEAASFTTCSVATTSTSATHIQHSSGPIPLKDRRVAVVVTFTRDGFGDLSAGFKFLELLNTAAKVPKDKIWMFTNAGKADINRFNSKKWQVEKVENATKLKKQMDLLQIQFMLVAPTLDWKYDVQTWAVPKAFIVEYGYRTKSPSIAMGVRDEDIGIFIDPALREISQKNEDGPTRLSRLSKVPQSLCDAILGPLKTTHADRCAAFHADSRFYFGYGKSAKSRSDFVLNIAAKTFQKCNEKLNLTFYMPGKRLFYSPSSSNVTNFFKLGASVVRQFDFDANDDKINLVDEHVNKGAAAVTQLKERVVTIITGSGLPHEQFVEALIASDDEVLVMGDQSFSEAVALSKLITYECRHHKEDFFKDLAEVAYEEGGWEFSRLFQLSRLGDANVMGFESFFDRSSWSNVDFLYHCATKYKAVWKKFIERICTKYDIRNKFVTHLESFLKDDPLVGSTAKTYAELDPQPFGGKLKQLPFDKKVYISLKQMCDLKIRGDTGKSDLPEFSDSTFEWENSTDGYNITRTKIPKK